jgi:hypothetical protein
LGSQHRGLADRFADERRRNSLLCRHRTGRRLRGTDCAGVPPRNCLSRTLLPHLHSNRPVRWKMVLGIGRQLGRLFRGNFWPGRRHSTRNRILSSRGCSACNCASADAQGWETKHEQEFIRRLSTMGHTFANCHSDGSGFSTYSSCISTRTPTDRLVSSFSYLCDCPNELHASSRRRSGRNQILARSSRRIVHFRHVLPRPRSHDKTVGNSRLVRFRAHRFFGCPLLFAMGD